MMVNMLCFKKILHGTILRSQLMSFSSQSNLSHVDENGKAQMVDVSGKLDSARFAKAGATILVGEKVFGLIEQNLVKKGDVLTVAQLAGIMGAKRTSELIPLCHNINLQQVQVNLKLNASAHSVEVISSVKCIGKTGVEMEALTGAAVAALTVYDMCKGINKQIIISNIKLLEKTGGKSGDYNANS